MTDAKDFAILFSILREPFASFRSLGVPLGLSGVTVKARLNHLERAGAVHLWGVPAPEVFHRHTRLFVYSRVASRVRAVALARKSASVVRVAEGHERSFEINTYAETADAPAPPDLVSELGKPDFAATMHISTTKERDRVLSPLDWRILLPLVRRPRASVQEIAELSGLSRKTVRLHRDALFKKNLFRVLPTLTGARAPGLVMYRLFLFDGSSSVTDRERILGALPQTVFIGWTERPAGLWLTGGAPTMAHVLQVRDRAERVPGVGRVELDVFRRNEILPERFEGWIRDELRRWETRR